MSVARCDARNRNTVGERVANAVKPYGSECRIYFGQFEWNYFPALPTAPLRYRFQRIIQCCVASGYVDDFENCNLAA